MIPKYFPTSFTCTTDGSGYWSKTIKQVRVVALVIDRDELQAYFHKDDWNVSSDGMIYTDRQWLDELLMHLTHLFKIEITKKDVDYSEQGMQGHRYVSLDIYKTSQFESGKAESNKFLYGWYKHFIKENPSQFLTDEKKWVREFAKDLISTKNILNVLPYKNMGS